MTEKIPGYKPNALELYRCQTADEFPGLLNFLSAFNFTGRAEVVALDILGRGYLFFENGRVVHATEGTNRGIDAVARMLVWERCEVHLVRRVASPARDFTCPTNTLIMDATLLADQNAALWRSQARKLENVPDPNPIDLADGRLPKWRLDGRSVLIVSLAAVLVIMLILDGCRLLRGEPADLLGTPGHGPKPERFLRRLERGKAHVLTDIGLRMIAIPGGSFEREYSDEVSGRRGLARAEIDSFWMSRYEVTQGCYESLMGTNPSTFNGKNLPVEGVSWHDAERFCERLTGAARAAGRIPDGWEYRLPTELEWEYACLAQADSPATAALKEMAWFRNNADKSTHQVGTKQPNAWGLHDMHGNVNEWCLDWMGRVPFEQGDSEGQRALRGCRGGSWLQAMEYCLPSMRIPMQWESANNIIGFRPVLARVGRLPRVRWD